MFDTDELLARLERKGVRNFEIAKALGLPDSRVPEIRRKDRALKLDEAVKLVEAFGLERDQAAAPIPPSILRLLVQYVGLRLGAQEARIHSVSGELTEDLRAFFEFVLDPKVRRSIEAAEGFFRAMLLRRPISESTAQEETDPVRSR